MLDFINKIIFLTTIGNEFRSIFERNLGKKGSYKTVNLSRALWQVAMYLRKPRVSNKQYLPNEPQRAGVFCNDNDLH